MYTKRKSRHSFTLEEDQILSQLVEKYGERCNWKKIAQKMANRDARQCRDRWNHYLSPCNNSSDWKIEEDQLLMKLYDENGRKWSSFKSKFPGRTAVNIKSRWYKLNQKILKSSQIQNPNLMIVNNKNYKSNQMALFSNNNLKFPILKNTNYFIASYPKQFIVPNIKTNLKTEPNDPLGNHFVPELKKTENTPNENEKNVSDSTNANSTDYKTNDSQNIQQEFNDIISSKYFEDDDDFMNFFEPDPQYNFFSENYVL